MVSLLVLKLYFLYSLWYWVNTYIGGGIWHSEIALCWALLVSERVTIFRAVNPSPYVTSYPDQLSLAVSAWVGTIGIGQRVVMPCRWEGNHGPSADYWQVCTCVDNCHSHDVSRNQTSAPSCMVLRRLCYLLIKSLAVSTTANAVNCRESSQMSIFCVWFNSLLMG